MGFGNRGDIMKKVFIYFLSLVVFLTGCTANYCIEYKDNKFKEYLEVSGTEIGDNIPSYEDARINGVYADIDSLEKFELSPDSSNTQAFLTHYLEEVTLDKLRIPSTCFSLKSYDETEDYYYVSYFGDFYCDYVKNGKFTLVTDKKVLIHNADVVDGESYTWNLDSDKIKEEGINFEVSKKLKADAINNDIFNLLTILKIILGILFVMFASVVIFYLKKRMDEDKI